MSTYERVDKKIEIPSDIRYIKKVSKSILKPLQRMKIDKSLQFDIRLAVEEALVNAIEHGSNHKKDLPVVISYMVDKDKIEIEVEDQGKGFDLNNTSDPRDRENLMKEGGRGIFLMHKLMDSVSYNEKGNKVKMAKFFK
jgi:serine/threonine-protein kinase RsbW